MEILEARQTADAVQRQVKNLQTLQILQPFNPLQLVLPLDADRKGTHLRRQVRVFMNMHAYVTGFQPAALLHTQLIIP